MGLGACSASRLGGDNLVPQYVPRTTKMKEVKPAPLCNRIQKMGFQLVSCVEKLKEITF